jgi:hypothetical protein
MVVADQVAQERVEDVVVQIRQGCTFERYSDKKAIATVGGAAYAHGWRQ